MTARKSRGTDTRPTENSCLSPEFRAELAAAHSNAANLLRALTPTEILRRKSVVKGKTTEEAAGRPQLTITEPPIVDSAQKLPGVVNAFGKHADGITMCRAARLEGNACRCFRSLITTVSLPRLQLA